MGSKGKKAGHVQDPLAPAQGALDRIFGGPVDAAFKALDDASKATRPAPVPNAGLPADETVTLWSGTAFDPRNAAPTSPAADPVAPSVADPKAPADSPKPGSQTIETPAAPAAPASPQVLDLKNPPPPAAYAGLHSPIEGDISLLPCETAPVDGSMSLLRVLSPFIIRVEPPLVYANWTPGKVGKQFGVYDAALQGSSAYQDSRTNLSTSLLNKDNVTANQGGAAPGTVAYKGGGDTSTSPTSGTTAAPGYPGGKPSKADMMTALDIAMQLKAAMSAPPLILLINPQSFQVQYNKVQQFQDRTRHGYVFQAWGEEQPKITFSVKCGAYYSWARGVQRASRADSASWQNLMSLFALYRNNGYIYDTVGQSNAHHLVGALSIQYDQNIYYGHMDSLTWTEEEAQQHGGISMEIAFTVSAMSDRSQPTFAVTPMRNPISMDLYQRASNMQAYSTPESRAVNPAGVYSVGVSSEGWFLETQGKTVAGNDGNDVRLKPSAGLPGGR